MDWFAILTGIVTLLAFGLQISDLFSQYKNVKKSIFLVVLGIFIGNLLSFFNTSSVKLAFPFTILNLFTVALIIILFVSIMRVLFTKDEVEQIPAFVIALLSGTVILGILFVSGIASSKDTNCDINIRELNILVKEAKENKNYERALIHLEKIKNKLSKKDSIHTKRVKEKIKQIKQKQFEIE